eukprot:11182661-Lingulodinium_polyedra.AAC.1
METSFGFVHRATGRWRTRPPRPRRSIPFLTVWWRRRQGGGRLRFWPGCLFVERFLVFLPPWEE